MDNDSILVDRVLKGDPDSFALLVQRYQKQLYGFLLKLTFSRQDAEEILQDVFIRAYNYLYKFDKDLSFSSWLYKIAANTFKTHYNKKKKIVNTEVPEEIPEELCSPDDSPEAKYEKKEQYIEVLRQINCLSEDQKTAFLLKYVKDYTYAETGKILGISAQAAKMKVMRAKQTLGDRLYAIRKRGV